MIYFFHHFELPAVLELAQQRAVPPAPPATNPPHVVRVERLLADSLTVPNQRGHQPSMDDNVPVPGEQASPSLTFDLGHSGADGVNLQQSVVNEDPIASTDTDAPQRGRSHAEHLSPLPHSIMSKAGCGVNDVTVNQQSAEDSFSVGKEAPEERDSEMCSVDGRSATAVDGNGACARRTSDEHGCDLRLRTKSTDNDALDSRRAE